MKGIAIEVTKLHCNVTLDLRLTRKLAYGQKTRDSSVWLLQPAYLGSGSFKVIDLGVLESESPVLVMICSKSKSKLLKLLTVKLSKPVSNCFVAVQVNSSRNRTFSRGMQLQCWRRRDPLNLGGWQLHCWNLHSMLKISYAGCLGLSQTVAVQLTVEMRVAAWHREKTS